jgi:hypothetical protein
MRKTKQIFSVAFVVLGALLIVRGAYPDPWPVSLQLIAGFLLVVVGLLRLRYF